VVEGLLNTLRRPSDDTDTVIMTSSRSLHHKKNQHHNGKSCLVWPCCLPSEWSEIRSGDYLPHTVWGLSTFWPRKISIFSDWLRTNYVWSLLVSTISWTFEAIHKEHIRHICLKQLETWVVVEQWINTAHHIDFNSISMLGLATRYTDCLVREADEIQLHPINFNRDEGLTLSHT
jgi:hypothetical protein